MQAPSVGVDRYTFLASAVAVRNVSVRLAPDSQSAAFTDGQSIIVADVQDVALVVAVQAALIGAGSLDHVVMRQLVGRRTITERYLYCEVLRATKQCAARLPLWVTQRPELTDPLTNGASESLEYAKGRLALPVAPLWFGSIRPVRVLSNLASREGLGALVGRQPAQKFATAAASELDDDDAGEDGKILKLLQSPVPFRNPLSSMLNSILGAGLGKGARDRTENGDFGGDLPVGRVELMFRRGINAVLSRLHLSAMTPDTSASRPKLMYSEWDVHNQRYRRDWVSIFEVDAWRVDEAQNAGELMMLPSLELQRQLGSLGLDHELHRRQKEGADLDTSALIDCAIELRTGHSPAIANIYRASRKTRRDLAVALIIDISGSTGEADAQGNSVFGRQLQLAFRLGHALVALGDSVAMLGFHSWGRERAHVVRIKEFDERWSAKVTQRMGNLEPVGYTRIGAALRYGSDLLQNRIRLPNRLLILITDGIAFDQDYEQSYAEGDARKALDEAKEGGTACVCISVGAGTEVAKLKAVFGAANLLVVDEVDQATSRVRRIFRDALDRVSRRRTHSQQTF